LSENSEKWIEIAEGGDGYNTSWDGEFAPLMEQIERYIDAIEVEQLEVDWNEICDTVPALRGKDWDISKDQASRALLESLEYCMDCHLVDWEWDGGMPGQSGNMFKLELKTSQKQSFLQSMEQLRNSLENYWRKHDLPE
jgi:hypothetical protein